VDAITTQPVADLTGLPVDDSTPIPDERRVALLDVLKAFSSSRLLIWVAGIVAVLAVGFYPGSTALLDSHHLTAPFPARLANVLISPAARWDSAWYLSIAKSGYQFSSQTVFFPLYPVLIALGGVVVGSELDAVVGIAISCACAIGALYLLHRLVTLEFDAGVARNTIWIVAWLPTAMALSSVYSEALFLVLAVGSFYAGRQGRWVLAGLLGGLAAASRNGGILLLLPLLIFYLYGPRSDREPDYPAANGLRSQLRLWPRILPSPRYRLRSDVLWIALVPLGLIAYMTYLAFTVGHPLDPFTHQQHWGRYFFPLGGIPLGIWKVLRDTVALVPSLEPHLAHNLTFSGSMRHVYALAFLVLALLLLRICWKRLPAAYTAFAAISLAMAVSVPASNEPLKSLPRFTLVMFPLWIALALWATEHRRVRTVIVVSAPLLALSTYLFVAWSWPP
jgi:hypothetical protein